MQKKRPVNLNLLTIKFPITAIVSILHRVSGTFLFLLIPVLLWILAQSLTGPLQFENIKDILSSSFVKFIVWVSLVALLYHFAAGIRHLIMDMGIAEDLPNARLGAKVVMVVTVILSLLAGIWLW